MSNIGIVHKDKQYATFKAIVAKVQQSVDLDAIVQECTVLHNSRISTKIKDNKGQFRPELLIDANAIDLSNRSRMTYLASDLQLKLSKLDSAIEAFENYVITNYSQAFQLNSVDARKRFARSCMKNQVKYYTQGKATLDFVNALIKDIDQTGFNLRNMVDLLKILSEKKV